jgi:hypothetical protein
MLKNSVYQRDASREETRRRFVEGTVGLTAKPRMWRSKASIHQHDEVIEGRRNLVSKSTTPYLEITLGLESIFKHGVFRT